MQNIQLSAPSDLYCHAIIITNKRKKRQKKRPTKKNVVSRRNEENRIALNKDRHGKYNMDSETSSVGNHIFFLPPKMILCSLFLIAIFGYAMPTVAGPNSDCETQGEIFFGHFLWLLHILFVQCLLRIVVELVHVNNASFAVGAIMTQCHILLLLLFRHSIWWKFRHSCQ